MPSKADGTLTPLMVGGASLTVIVAVVFMRLIESNVFATPKDIEVAKGQVYSQVINQADSRYVQKDVLELELKQLRVGVDNLQEDIDEIKALIRSNHERQHYTTPQDYRKIPCPIGVSGDYCLVPVAR